MNLTHIENNFTELHKFAPNLTHFTKTDTIFIKFRTIVKQTYQIYHYCVPTLAHMWFNICWNLPNVIQRWSRFTKFGGHVAQFYHIWYKVHSNLVNNIWPAFARKLACFAKTLAKFTKSWKTKACTNLSSVPQNLVHTYPQSWFKFATCFGLN